MSTPQVKFTSSHRPQLSDGEYTIDVSQTITAAHADADGPKGAKTKVSTRTFEVLGERFSLKPADIHSIFPPNRSRGEYSAALPQVILNRSTLPWERTAQGTANTKDSAPWLVLLLFTEKELSGVKPQVVTLDTFQSKSTSGTYWPKITLQSGQAPKNKVTVIDVPKKILSPLMPTLKELGYLTHARLVSGETDAKENHEFAVVVGNRLPQKSIGNGKPPIMVAHLVSVEGRYSGGSFDHQGAGEDDKIRLISLKSWSFSCVEHKYTFTGLLKKLDQGTLESPLLKKIPADAKPSAKKTATTQLGQGKVPLRHHFRGGQQSVSWYHGPLSPMNYSQAFADHHPIEKKEFPHQSADGLLRYDKTLGMFDVSYAAAWELGRLLALNSKSLSINLYHWKRAHAQELRKVEQQELHPHKPHLTAPTNSLLMPKDIEQWFSDLSLLKHVPFNYLVPDSEMLPSESIRFFTLDLEWIACIVDGAFSIGRVTAAESRSRKAHPNQLKIPEQSISGILVRSAVVAGWPALLVDAFDSDKSKLPLLRMERLSPNVLICLFKGDASEYDIHQKPQTIHCGFTRAENKYQKKLRNAQGKETGPTVDVPLKQDSDHKNTVVRLEGGEGLYQLIQKKSSNLSFKQPYSVGQFALQLMEGVPRVKFTRASK